MRSSVVVVSYRPGPWLERSVQSVLDQADEVVVVDNGSPDEEATRTANRLGARSVTLDHNIGFAAGVNLGVAVCTGDVIALLNDDAFAGPGWLKLSTAVLGDPTVAVVAPKLLFDTPHVEIRLDEEAHFAPPDPRPLGRLVQRICVGGIDVLENVLGPGIHALEKGPPGPPRWRWTSGSGPIYLPIPTDAESNDVLVDGEPVLSCAVIDLVNNAGSYLSADGYGGDYGFATPDRGAFDSSGERFAACGAAMVVRRDTLWRVGSFAENFFAYYEDTDWCWRARLGGLRVLYEPSVSVRHLGGATSGGPDATWVRRLAARNRMATLVRNAPWGVVARQLRRARQEELWPRYRMSLGKALPQAAVHRLLLARSWVRTPREVWDEWAGVGEDWQGDGAPA